MCIRDSLNGLWNLSCSSAILDPAILSDLVKNGFYINQCYSMTELAGYGLLLSLIHISVVLWNTYCRVIRPTPGPSGRPQW